MTGRMPTEMQCLAQRMHDSAGALARMATRILDVHAADAGWVVGAPEPAGLSVLAAEMLAQARGMEFDALRLEFLADDHADEGRTLYTMAMDMVDSCRFARAQDAAMAVLADATEAGLADMQEHIAGWFPGETIPGG